MAITTLIEGSAENISTAGHWVTKRLHPTLADAALSLRGAQSDARSGWTGSAATAFTGRMATCETSTQTIADDGERVGSALTTYATALRTAQHDMATIRDDAAHAGLTLTDATIEDPGPGPGRPFATGDLTAAQERTFQQLTVDFESHQKKIEAYHHAQIEASAVDSTLESAKTVLTNFVAEITGKWPLTASDFAVGVGGAFAKLHSSILTKHAAFLAEDAAEALDHYLNSPGGSAASRLNNQRIMDSTLAAAEERAGAVKWGSVASKLDKGGPLLAIAGVGYDISTGKSPGKAILSGAVGFGAGAIVVASAPVSVPVVVVGVVAVGAGVGAGMLADYAWDHFVPDGAKEAIDDGLDAVGGGAKDLAGKAGGAAEDAWNAVF